MTLRRPARGRRPPWPLSETGRRRSRRNKPCSRQSPRRRSSVTGGTGNRRRSKLTASTTGTRSCRGSGDARSPGSRNGTSGAGLFRCAIRQRWRIARRRSCGDRLPKNEIVKLQWREADETALNLADSKTGPRKVFLNAQARAIVERQPPGRTTRMFFRRRRTRPGPDRGILRSGTKQGTGPGWKTCASTICAIPSPVTRSCRASRCRSWRGCSATGTCG